MPNLYIWVAPISPEARKLCQKYSEFGIYRIFRARKDLKEWFEKVDYPYYSTHKFRHGFAVYSLKHAKDIGQLKAISQNLMHENLSITDGIYGILSESDVKDQINSLGARDNLTDKDDLQKLMHLNKELIRKIEDNYLPINRDNIEE